MRLRLIVLAALCALAAGCRRPDPYWREVDALYLQASQVFTSGYSNPTPESVTQLATLRDQIDALPHPAAANGYHGLLVKELDSGVAVLSALRDHNDARASQANLTLRQLQKQVDDERRRVGPKS